MNLKVISYLVVLSVTFFSIGYAFLSFPWLSSTFRSVRTSGKYHHTPWTAQRRQVQTNPDVIATDTNPRENLKVLISFQARLFPQENLLGVIWAWSHEKMQEQDDESTAIVFSKTEDGCHITFNAAPNTALSIYVQETGQELTRVTSVHSTLQNDIDDVKLKSLIEFSSTNLLDSLLAYIGAWIFNSNENNNGGKKELQTESRIIETIQTPINTFPTIEVEEVHENVHPNVGRDDKNGDENKSDVDNTDIIDMESTFEILKEWTNVKREQKSTLLKYLRTWSKNYAGRGIGINSEDLPSGISFTFDAFPADTYRYEVDYVDDSSGSCLQVRGMWGTHDDDSSLKRYRDDLVVRAITNLNSALNKDLSTLMLEDDDIEIMEKKKPPLEPVSTSETSQSRVNDGYETSRSMNVPKKQLNEKTQQPSKSRRRDPLLQERAADLGLNLEKFEDESLAEQAMEELNNMVSNSRNTGYLGFLKQNASDIIGSKKSDKTAIRQVFEVGSKTSVDKGREILDEENVQMKLQEILSRKPIETDEDLSKPPTKLPINLSAAGLEKGIDILEGPPIYDSNGVAHAPASSVVGKEEAAQNSAIYSHISTPSTEELKTDSKRLDMLVAALLRADEAMYDMILDSYRDLLLSSSFISLMKGMNETVADNETAKVCAKIANKATELTQELAGLVKAESVRHLQTIHEICEISVKFQHDELKFLEMLDTVRHKFDTALLSYLKFAIEEEEAIIKSNGGDPVKLPSIWLQVLLVVQRGVFAEFESRYEGLLEPLLLVVRFDDRYIQERVFERFVNITAPLELPYLRQLAINMVTSIEEDTEKWSIQDDQMRGNVLALHDLIEKYLSDEYIEEKLRVLRKNTESRGQEMKLAYRNKDVQAINEALEEVVTTTQLPNGRQNKVGDSILDMATEDVTKTANKRNYDEESN